MGPLRRWSSCVERALADLLVAEMIPAGGDIRRPLFEGSDLSVTFVRAAVGPNVRPGLEIIRRIEKVDDQGLALVRERGSFAPISADAQIRFADQVSDPCAVSGEFCLSAADQVWQPTWRGQMKLPGMIRMSVRDSTTGQVLAVSSAAVVNSPAECA